MSVVRSTARLRMTEQAFLALPDDGRKYELVDGEAIEVPAGVRHDILGANIIVLLKPYTKGRGYLCGSQAGFRMQTGNVRSPDVSFVLAERFPDGQPPEGFGDFAPDLCIEIISPREDREEMKQKLLEYFASGAQQVWYLFPEPQRVIVYTGFTPTSTASAVYEDEEWIDGGPLLPGFRCRARELFDLG